mmetsp:Transcript_10798/g.23912  ORF Transcript_10798/g.23912 Transcript_10798/m.23912 type:complete len:272 (-) Transcript_10798:295-1110(-)
MPRPCVDPIARRVFQPILLPIILLPILLRLSGLYMIALIPRVVSCSGYLLVCLEGRDGVAAHVQVQVVHVVVDGGDVPLVGAVGVLVAHAGVQHVVLVLVPLPSNVREPLVHGRVHHHVLVVSYTGVVTQQRGGVGREFFVADTGRPEVEQSEARGGDGLLEVVDGERGHGRAQAVARHHHGVGGVLLQQGGDLLSHKGEHRLLCFQEALVYLAARAGVVGHDYVEVVHPVLDAGGSSEDHVDGGLGGVEADVSLDVVGFVVDHVGGGEAC